MLNKAVQDSNLTEVFTLLYQAFFNLTSKPIKQQFIIGDYCIELVFPNSQLIQIITTAFEHLKNQEHKIKSDLTIYLWDLESTACKLPRIDLSSIVAKGYYGIENSFIKMQYFQDIDALSAINLQENTAIYLVKSSKKLPWWVSGSPLQVLFNWWLKGKGLQLTHAGAIANSEGAVIFAGRGGSGKSTTVLSCVEQGLEYLSEDYCLVKDGLIPYVYSIYSSAKLEPRTLEKFPQYNKFVKNKNRQVKEKSLLFYQDIFPGSIREKAPIKALVALTVTSNKKPTIEFAEKNIMLSKLLSSTAVQLPGCDYTTFAILDNVTTSVPGYNLHLGTDTQDNVDMIRDLLK